MNTQIKTNTLAFITLALIVIGAFAVTMPASAFWSHNDSGDDNDIKVSVSNSATVNNTVEVEAETGDNEADGGDGDEGGNGGDAEGSGDNTGGSGGNGGSGALGGYIVSGDAAAYSSIVNEVNVVKTKISDSCGCDEEDDAPSMFSFFNRRGSDDGDDNDIRVRIDNSASVANDVEVEAETGDNEADGGDGDEGGNGGDAENRGHHNMRSFFSFWSQDNNQGGAGGTGGNGGVGGEIYSGNATSGSEVVNVVNRIVTRITR